MSVPRVRQAKGASIAMTPEQKAAYVIAQAACASAEIAAMQAANQQRERQGFAQAWDEAAFLSIPDKYGIHHNAVISLFMDR